MPLWFFHRTAPGQIKRIPTPSMQRFLAGERKLPHDGDKFVRCIGLSVNLNRGKPAAVGRMWFSKIRVREDGTVDPDHRPALLRALQKDAAEQAQVVEARHLFAERTLQHMAEWRPEPADVDALREIINTRAGVGIL